MSETEKSVPAMDWITFAIRDLCEIPDRDSPDDHPEWIIVTDLEIRTAIERNIPRASLSTASEPTMMQREKMMDEQETY